MKNMKGEQLQQQLDYNNNNTNNEDENQFQKKRLAKQKCSQYMSSTNKYDYQGEEIHY